MEIVYLKSKKIIMKIQKYAIYARTATDTSSSANLKKQINVIKQFVEKCGYDVDSEFIFSDARQSGLSDTRRGLNRLKNAVKKGLIEGILVADIDRVYRDLMKCIAFIKFIDRYNVKLLLINSHTDNFVDMAEVGEFEKGIMEEVEKQAKRNFAKKQRQYRAYLKNKGIA